MAQLRVRDVMTTQVFTLKPTNTVKEATVELAVDSISGVPVVDDKHRIVGIVSETDILNLLLKYQAKLSTDDPSLYMLLSPMDDDSQEEHVRAANKAVSETLVKDIMTVTLITTTPDAKIVDVVKVMIERGVNRIPVLEKGTLVGVISRADIIFAIYKRKV